MEIKQVNIQTQCTKTTVNAKYEIEYNVSDKLLTRVNASIYKLKPEDTDEYLGTITLDGNYLSGTFPYKEDIAPNKYFEDFSTIMEEIKEAVAKQPAYLSKQK